MSRRIYIYDTTLRDGAQTEGISFSTEDKLELIRLFGHFGMDFIEGGMPSSNPRDRELFSENVPECGRSSLVAFGSTCRPNTEASEDEGLKALAECGCEWVCIFGKAWDFQVTDALNTTLEENLRMIRDSIAFLRSKGKKVIFDAEHYFDGFKANEEYALDVVRSALDAEWIVLCDTNGGSLPSEVGSATAVTVSMFRKKMGIHCHNDSDLAVACTLAAVEAGATMVQGTVNGIGERCGNANLCSVIPDLRFKMDMEVPVDLTLLTSLSRAVAETANMHHMPHMPYVGEKAFAHKGGMHVSALMKNTSTYEHVPPETVGNKRRILISEMSGNATISGKLTELMHIDADKSTVENIKAIVKEKESKGYQYEGAEASFYILVKKASEGYVSPFSVQGFRLTMDGTGMNGIAEASIKVKDTNGNIEHTAADGEDGPVDALDKALRKALSKFYPVINSVRLTDYKVRVLDEKAATAAMVRVLIRSTDGRNSWSTVGVSENVIEASLIALSDSMEYAIIKADTKG